MTTANRCVYERKDAQTRRRTSYPSGNDRYMVAADLQAAPHNVANPRTCPMPRVLPLTNDKQR